jgi:hypothetical protein
MDLPSDIPAEAVPFLESVGYLEPDALRPGDPIPDLPLFTPSGEAVRLRALGGGRPLVLIFGSYT